MRAAVAGVSPAFEVNQRRIRGDTTPGMRIADDLANWGLVVGPVVEAPADLGPVRVGPVLRGPLEVQPAELLH